MDRAVGASMPDQDNRIVHGSVVDCFRHEHPQCVSDRWCSWTNDSRAEGPAPYQPGPRGGPAALQTNNVSVPIHPHWIVPPIPIVSHALARMQWALVGAKRLECGSLLPLCPYAQTTCLEPDRHDAENNVSVPISACAGFPHRLPQPPIGARDNLLATPRSWENTQITSLSLYLGPHPDNEPVTYLRLTTKSCAVVTGLLAAREADRKELTKLATRKSSRI